MVLAVADPWASASSYLSSASVADSRCNPHATPEPAVFLSFALAYEGRERFLAIPNNSNTHISLVIWGLEPCSRARETCRLGCQVRAKERKKENRQPKGGMGGRYTATTQGF